MRTRGLTASGGLRPRLLICSLAVAGLWVAVVFAAAPPASAHADFLGSDPADEQVLTEPVTEIELRFSGTVYPDLSVGRLLDGNGRRLEAQVFQRTTDHLIVQPAQPLTDGLFALVWETAAEDGHRVEGALRFRVTGAVSAAPDATTTTTTAPPVSTEVAAESPPTTFTPTRPPVAAQPASTGADLLDGTSESGAEQIADLVGAMGRWVSLLGALLAVGATAFAAFALTGTVAEIRRVVGWIRTAGILLVAGTVTEVLMFAAAAEGWGILTDPVGILDAVPTGLAAAAVLRIAGGVALLQSPTLVTVTTRQPDAVTAGSGPATSIATIERTPDEPRRLVVREEWLILAGLGAVAVSYLLDGHSASLGLLPRTANLVHVVAGGVWFGGVVVLADVALRRRRTKGPTHVGEMTVRFSRVATVALVAVAVAGSLLAWGIVDEPSELMSGTWGRLLIGKVAFVAVAAGIGAYNHFRVVPRLGEDPTSDQSATLARTLTAEAVALVIVVAITAALVVSAP